MALLTCITPAAGTTTVPVPVSSTDTISGNDVNNGAILIVLTAGTGDNVTITDPGRTPAGNTGTQAAASIGTNSGKSWGPGTLRNFIDPVTNLVTVNHSATTNVTCLLVTDAD